MNNVYTQLKCYFASCCYSSKGFRTSILNNTSKYIYEYVVARNEANIIEILNAVISRSINHEQDKSQNKSHHRSDNKPKNRQSN